MNTFDERERAFEAKFAHDAEMQFNATARRNHLLATWAAALLDKSTTQTKAYAADFVKYAMQTPGDDELAERLAQDLGAHADPSSIRAQMDVLMAEAKQQIAAET